MLAIIVMMSFNPSPINEICGLVRGGVTQVQVSFAESRMTEHFKAVSCQRGAASRGAV